MDAFSIGLSGLMANSEAVDAVGNNLANSNTPGYKATNVQFRDLISIPDQPGLGVASPILTTTFTQGSVQASAGPLDAAISGDGFFILKSADGSQLYSRAGNFQLDAQGRLIGSGGEAVQGWSGTVSGVDPNGPIGDIVVPAGALRPASATTTLTLSLNLNAAGAVGEPTGSFTTGAQVFDSLGTAHTVSFAFTKTGPNAWSYTATMPGEDFTSGTAGTPQQVATGTLVFDASGNLTTPAPPGTVDIKATGLADGAADLSMAWSLYGADATSKITQMALPSGLSASDQDGYAAAQVLSVSMGDGGKIQARLSNGEDTTVGQLALADFRNPTSLESVGNNLLAVSSSTSAAAIGTAESAGRGKIIAKCLEASTVDMAQEFTKLIVYQRAYQANSRVITTTNEMLQETLNLKQ
jgi:flagellar hook protein FlgE